MPGDYGCDENGKDFMKLLNQKFDVFNRQKTKGNEAFVSYKRKDAI